MRDTDTEREIERKRVVLRAQVGIRVCVGMSSGKSSRTARSTVLYMFSGCMPGVVMFYGAYSINEETLYNAQLDSGFLSLRYTNNM